MKVNELTEGPVSNAISGLVGAARAKSKDPSIAAKGKRQLAKAGSRKAGSAAGTKRKKRQMVDGMLDAWSKVSNKKLVAGQEPEEGDYLEWLGDFMGDARRAKLANLGAPEGMKDRHIRKHLQSVVNTFFDKPKAKMNDLDNVDMRNLSNARARQKSLSHQPAQIGQDAQFALPAPTRAESIIMQDKYNQYLLEADARIQHAEDIVFWEGSKGAKRALKALKDMASRKHKDVTLK